MSHRRQVVIAATLAVAFLAGCGSQDPTVDVADEPAVDDGPVDQTTDAEHDACELLDAATITAVTGLDVGEGGPEDLAEPGSDCTWVAEGDEGVDTVTLTVVPADDLPDGRTLDATVAELRELDAPVTDLEDLGEVAFVGTTAVVLVRDDTLVTVRVLADVDGQARSALAAEVADRL